MTDKEKALAEIGSEKITVTKTQTLSVGWCKNPAFVFGRYKAMRNSVDLTVEPACFICDTMFDGGDEIALVNLIQRSGRSSNEIICQNCAKDCEK